MKAFPLDGVTECLAAIAREAETTLSIVSGRPVHEVLELVGNIGITIVGSHGWEIWTGSEKPRLIQPAPEQVQRLEEARVELSQRGLDHRAERKIASLAVHTRGLPRDRAEEIENDLVDLWRPDAANHGMECRRFNGGVELRAQGMDKGTILHELLKDEQAEAFCVYAGDDETDEDAFREIRDRGFGIKVGQRDVATAAQGWLPDCEAVLEFLRGWIHVTHLAGA
jgi:trehalose 6-phosphate phosphatase